MTHFVNGQPVHLAARMEQLEFFDFAYRDGGQAAIVLHYSPLPMAASGSIRTAGKSQIRDAAGKPVWQ
jgi:phosphate transport system substrate-binding protein